MFDRRHFLIRSAASIAALASARAFAADKITPDAKSVLVVVDVQNCFLPGGSLAVKDGELRIYSWGSDGVDDGGVTNTKRWDAPDYTFVTR